MEYVQQDRYTSYLFLLFMVEILFEDSNIIIVNKPAQLATHPGGVYEDNSLFDSLKEKYETIHLINRLDFDTSGIILCTKNKETAAALNKTMFEKNIQKKYLAIIFGELDKEIIINKPIAEKRGTHIRWKFKVIKQGKECITKIKPIHIFTNKNYKKETEKDDQTYTLIECTPITGRQHQIRVHLASIKHPIVGDKIYNRDRVFKYYTTNDHTLREEDLAIIKTPRMLLHSYYLSFPYENNQKIITAMPPKDFLDFLDEEGKEKLNSEHI